MTDGTAERGRLPFRDPIPDMTTTTSVIRQLAEEDATLVLEYGSSVIRPETANDVDLLAIYDDETGSKDNVRLGNYDIIRLTKAEFRTYRRTLNPVHCTEPVLKGEVRHGPESVFEELRVDVRERDPAPEAVRHNLCRSYAEYDKARWFLEQGDVEKAVQTLSFVASYRLFAAWYADGNTPETLDCVRDEVNTNLPVQTAFDLLNAMKDGASLELERVTEAMETWEATVLSV